METSVAIPLGVHVAVQELRASRSRRRTSGGKDNSLDEEDPAYTSNTLLRPAFVEWLMGLPEGWTDVNRCDAKDFEPHDGWKEWLNPPPEGCPWEQPGATVEIDAPQQHERCRALGNALVPIAAWGGVPHARWFLPAQTPRRSSDSAHHTTSQPRGDGGGPVPRSRSRRSVAQRNLARGERARARARARVEAKICVDHGRSNSSPDERRRRDAYPRTMEARDAAKIRSGGSADGGGNSDSPGAGVSGYRHVYGVLYPTSDLPRSCGVADGAAELMRQFTQARRDAELKHANEMLRVQEEILRENTAFGVDDKKDDK